MNWQIDIAAATRPRGDEVVGGDMMFSKVYDEQAHMVCMDVLGHGRKAHEVAQLSATHLQKTTVQTVFQPTKMLFELDQLLSGRLGAAVAVCHFNRINGQLTYAGVGNISVRRIFPKASTLVAKDGIVGSNMRTPKEQKIALEGGDIYLMHTDGIQSRFSHRDYSHIVSDNAASAVAHILQHFSKQHDDAGCIVFKVTSPQSQAHFKV